MPKTQPTREIEVDIENENGALAEVADQLGQQDINILGFMARADKGQGRANFVTNDPERAMETLKEAGYSPRTTESLIVPTANQPGELASLVRRLEEEDINVERSFVATGHEGQSLGIGLSVSDPSRARKMLEG